MAQFFSHLNGLTLSNTWGDMVRLLDTCLVNGKPLPSITTVALESEENIRILYAEPHNTMLFQLVELMGFLPEKYNSAFRVIGVPSTTELVLRVGTDVASSLPTVRGSSKIQSLGYEIVFRDALDVKRVYRAKNPRTEHPFIRVDESLTSPDGVTGVYNGNYAKSAIVGLVESMSHIDDFESSEVLQLPFDPIDPSKNWRISGTGGTVIRGGMKWYYSQSNTGYASTNESSHAPTSSSLVPSRFTLVGDSDCFYILSPASTTTGLLSAKHLKGLGLFDSSEENLYPWFLMAFDKTGVPASTTSSLYNNGGNPLVNDANSAKFFCTPFVQAPLASPHSKATPILLNYTSGGGSFSGRGYGCVAIPFYDETNKCLVGRLKHVLYNGDAYNSVLDTTPFIYGTSIFVKDAVYSNSASLVGSLAFYLGEL